MRTSFGGILAGHPFLLSYASRGSNGLYQSPSASTVGTAAFTPGIVHYTYLPLHVRAQLIRLGFGLPTAGTDPSYMARLGLYRNNSDGQPGALLLDAGQVPAGPGAPAAAEVLVPGLWLEPGGYWCALLMTGSGGSAPVGNTITASAVPQVGSVVPDNLQYFAYTLPGQTGLVDRPTGLVRSTLVAGSMAKFASA